jgi:hypothetical protein
MATATRNAPVVRNAPITINPSDLRDAGVNLKYAQIGTQLVLVVDLAKDGEPSSTGKMQIIGKSFGGFFTLDVTPTMKVNCNVGYSIK